MNPILNNGDVVAQRYRIDAYVGAGGMQQVYRSVDQALNRVVALKVPKNESAQKRFQRSAEMSAKVTHANVAKTFDYVEHEAHQFLIEEFVEGEDLKSRLTSHFYYLDPHLAAHVFHHLVKGVAAVHKVEVIHRDLKPSNIMVSCDPGISQIKITDFGIAKMTEAEFELGIQDGGSVFNSATVVGALPYMAPEVIKNKKTVGLSADIWSSGAILYQLLTGELPFGDGLAAVEKILKGNPPPQPAHLMSNNQFSQLVGRLWETILECMNHDPAARPTAAELVAQCGELCYSAAPRCLGTIKKFKPSTGAWGFIHCDDGFEEAFFHISSFWQGTPTAGARVCLSHYPGAPQRRAHPVLLLRPQPDSDDIPF